ncbi:MAG: two-component system, OmpR family, sensor histidine kinase ChvG [Pelagibacterales bacterium]|nr:two-component system, OmpR family, sensor histidine kinase ChvG [Pelagibacterales bacterium]
MKSKKSASILKKFLLFNLIIFTVLGLFTILYLKAIQPNLVKKITTNQISIINNTSDHIVRLKIDFDKNGIKKFLFSTRFLFQNLDRVQFYSKFGEIIGDTDILDLDQNVFSKSELILEENIDGSVLKKNNTEKTLKEESPSNKNIKRAIIEKYQDGPLILEEKIKNNFYVSTLKKIEINDNVFGYIMVTEEANDILIAVKERKNFIIRTVLAIGLVILIFSLFLNKYILKPIGLLVAFAEGIKNKSNKKIDIDKFFLRDDEVGQLTKSIDEMTKELKKRTERAETFSTDLAHEIRNPLASLKGASELLDKSAGNNDRIKLLKIINHDVERIERLITDYSQMLKDEASLSREKMSKIDIANITNNVVEDFKQDLFNQNKKIKINIIYKNGNGKGCYIFGIENRLEQVIANLLDNAISFSSENGKIEIEISSISSNYILIIRDEGPGFSEVSTQKIFKRFYSNRPKSFGEHSGLGLNIVKNIVELHKGTISASNRPNEKGAQIEVLLPKLV